MFLVTSPTCETENLWKRSSTRRLQSLYYHKPTSESWLSSCTWENVHQRSIIGIVISGAATWRMSPACNLSHSTAETGGWALVLIFNRSGNISRLCFRPVQVWLKGNGGVIASSNLLKRKLLVGVWAAASAAAASVSQLIGRGKRVLHLFTWWDLQQPQKRWI